MIRALAVMLVALLVGCSPDKPLAVDESKIQLTAEEQEYVDTHKDVTWVLEENRPPFTYVRNKKIKGVSKAYLDVISKKTGLRFKPVPVASFKEGLDAVQRGQIDVMPSIRPTPERAEFMAFTPPYAYHAGVFIFRQNSLPRSPLRAGICQGDAVSAYVRGRFPEMNVVEAVDNEEALALLEKGLLDVVVMNAASAEVLLNKSFVKMRTANADFDYPYSLGYKKDQVILGQILSKAIRSISAEDKRMLNFTHQKEQDRGSNVQ